jgi:diguanylate cyclase (GGDEF)-like protein
LRGFHALSEHGGIRSDLRQHVSNIILHYAERIADDALTAPSGDPAEAADADHRRQMTTELVQLLSYAVADGGTDGRTGLVAQLAAAAADHSIPERQLFATVAAVERATLDELAVNERVGAVTEDWGSVAQLVRRASFDLLAAIVGRILRDANAITDPMSDARTRAYFDAALATECDRAGRFGDRLAVIVLRVDEAAGLDARLGAGISDKIVGRLGILVRQFFRRQDLVARYAGDAVAVLLVRSDADHAEALADRIRVTIAQRLESADHRSGEAVAITVSAAVVHAGGASGAVIDPERLRVDAERALRRAAEHGGNRVEAIQSAAAIRTPPRNSPSA